MRERNPVVVVGLTLLTFTLYAYYWVFVTTHELREETGREDLHPLVDLMLTVITLGLWGFWVGYRNSRIVHEELVELGHARHIDRSAAVGVTCALTFFSGWAWLVAMALVQDDLNQLVRADAALAPARALPASRVRLEPTERAGEPTWSSAPSAPVFTSTAPAPIVF